MEQLLTDAEYQVLYNVLHQRYRDIADSKERSAWLREYNVFMHLKVELNDVYARLLSPSLVIERVWHLHVADTQAYATFCARVLDHKRGMLHCKPRSVPDPSEVHYLATYTRLPPASRAMAEIWPEPPVLSKLIDERAIDTQRKAAATRAPATIVAKEPPFWQAVDDDDGVLAPQTPPRRETGARKHAMRIPVPNEPPSDDDDGDDGDDVKEALPLRGEKRPAEESAAPAAKRTRLDNPLIGLRIYLPNGDVLRDEASPDDTVRHVLVFFMLV